MPAATGRRVRSRAAAAALALRVFEQRDLLTPNLRLAASPDGLLITKHVARDARAVTLTLRKLVLTDRILKGTAILKGHASEVMSCAFSPDGKRLVTANCYTAQLWDVETGALQATLEGHAGAIVSCAFSPGGERIVTGSHDNTARVWDAATGELLLSLEGHTSSVTSCAFSPDGKRLATASYDGTARLWDAETGPLLLTLEAHDDDCVVCCAFSPDGKRVVTGSGDGTARALGRRDGRAAADAHRAHQ